MTKFKLVGTSKPIDRIMTGFHTFDRAFRNQAGDIGFPMRGIIELAGPTGCGKTTMTLSLAGRIGKIREQNIAFADIEGFEPNLMTTIIENTGFGGELHLIDEVTDEKTLASLADTVFSEKLPFCVGIFDSIGALSPLAEKEGDLGEANMGRRARLLAQFSRKVNHRILNAKEGRVFFFINHLHPIMGGRGLTSPGGETIKYITTIQMRIRQCEQWDDGSYALEGTVRKNRFGFKNSKFYFVVLSGYGIHSGLTALYDGYKLGIVDRKRTVKIVDDKSYGYLQAIFDEARNGNDEFFTPFHSALESVDTNLLSEDERQDESENTEEYSD